MSGHGITDLRRPPRRFRVQGKAGFETREKATKEDRTRARMLRQQADVDSVRRSALLALADRLDPGITTRPGSAASSRYVRHHRGRIAGWLWRLCDRRHQQGVELVTVLPGNTRFSAAELADVGAARFKAAFRGSLIRAGAGNADGWLIAALHGEHDPATDRLHLHWHCVVAGGMRQVVKRLRDQRRYFHKGKPGSAADAVCTPIRFQRRRLTKLPAPLTYVVKSWWPSQDRSETGENGEPRKGLPKPRRIPEPIHSTLLLWLDGCRLQDLILMVNVRVINRRLQPR